MGLVDNHGGVSNIPVYDAERTTESGTWKASGQARNWETKVKGDE
jgi:hypothetical protein